MENGKEYSLPSGATIFVSVSPYEQVMALHDALGAELRGNGLGTLDVDKIQKSVQTAVKKRMASAAGTPFAEDGAGDEGQNVIVDKFIALACSKPLRLTLFACAEKALYRPDGTEATSIQFKLGTPGYGVFDNQTCMLQARGDYYEICKAIAEENLRPFGKALFSMFMAHMESGAATQG